MLTEQQCLNSLAIERPEMSGDKTKCISPTDGVSQASFIILWLENLHTLATLQVQNFLTEIWLYPHTFDRQTGERLKWERPRTLCSMPCSPGRVSLHNSTSYLMANVLVSRNLWGGATALWFGEKACVLWPLWMNPITESAKEMNACIRFICELIVHRHSRHDHFVSRRTHRTTLCSWRTKVSYPPTG